MATVKKQAKKEAANPHDSFAAVQLLNDPQVNRWPYPSGIVQHCQHGVTCTGDLYAFCCLTGSCAGLEHCLVARIPESLPRIL